MKKDIMENYGKKSEFASFLPEIAGLKGIPLWCYYVNRGQAVTCFGVENKDHPIMEFSPAHTAYREVKRLGFRTFYRIGGICFEAFRNENEIHRMEIGMNTLTLVEENQTHGIETTVTYFVLPGEPLAALLRIVEVKNTGDSKLDLEVLDGMPAIVPYGVGQDNLKNMIQTAKAWMQVEDHEKNTPYYRVRASLEDSAAVTEVKGGNFALSYRSDGTPLPITVDPAAIFSYDLSLDHPVTLEAGGLSAVKEAKQRMANLVPCAFTGQEMTLAPGQTTTLYELYGQAEAKEKLKDFLKEKHDQAWFEAKYAEAEALTEELTALIETKTADPTFDAYCRYTYLDNALRGGIPIRLGSNKIFYVYSRKHGDLERDYNYFAMMPEFFSQGNGNFRDVNQNRRCDTFFHPFVGRENIKSFYGLLQLDGYNPLGIEKLTYLCDCEKAEGLTAAVPERAQDTLCEFLSKPFTPGALYAKLSETLGEDFSESLFYQILDFSDRTVNGDFIEGYWTDHWTYNLDLIRDYLEIYPETEEELLYEAHYPWFIAQAKVNPRVKRYERTEAGLRQYHALDENVEQQADGKLLKADYGKGELIESTLLEKLAMLGALKTATLDPYGMGIEMEGGKPGWYDALNGLPGLLGSSMAETYELARSLDYTIEAIEKFPRDVEILEELADFVRALGKIDSSVSDAYRYWDESNTLKEAYRDKIWNGVSGRRVTVSSNELLKILKGFRARVQRGIEKALEAANGVAPTYFYYEATEIADTPDGPMPKAFRQQRVPDFLEGSVRYLKLGESPERKKALYQAVKNPANGLYDEKLSMYKVNASLQEASYELGRARAFTPGWLENESIWLHMEYKYLLELLRSGLYDEFFKDFQNAAVPFLNPETYGRSVLENSSFLASSRNPDESIHGKGFVARLSGSTVEFLSIWKLLFFGPSVFTVENGELTFTLSPSLPAYLIPDDGVVEARLFGKTKVTYQFPEKRDFLPGSYEITNLTLTYENGTTAECKEAKASGKTAEDIRSGRVSEIEVTIRSNSYGEKEDEKSSSL